MIRRILFTLFWIACFGIYFLVEYNYHMNYQKNADQQKVEHDFYEKYKDSIK